MNTLYVHDGSTYRLAAVPMIIEAANELLGAKYHTDFPPLTNLNGLHEFLLLKLGKLTHEVFAVVFLDDHDDLIEYVELFRGTLDGASVYPREVVKEAIIRQAAAVILVHNHPSGDAEPSKADIFVTKRLRDALALVDVKVLDHLVVGETITPFSQRGLL